MNRIRNTLEPPSTPERHLRERELADRWNISGRTLQRHRADGTGPAYIHIGGAIRYRLSDVLHYEEGMRRCANTDENGSAT